MNILILIVIPSLVIAIIMALVYFRLNFIELMTILIFSILLTTAIRLPHILKSYGEITSDTSTNIHETIFEKLDDIREHMGRDG